MASHETQALQRIRDVAKDEQAELDLSGLQLSEVPEQVNQINDLVSLRWQSGRLAEIPRSVFRLTQLRNLDLTDNRLTVLPSDVAELGNLRQLSLAGNRLQTLPPEIAQLGLLEELDVSNNHLHDLPEAILGLKKLRKLDLTSNLLQKLPEQLSTLKDLTDLMLAYNRLTFLPRNAGNLGSLRVLSLAYNQLTDLPPSISDLRDLKDLTLDGNPLSEALTAARRGGVESILTYLRSIQGTESALFEGKLLLLGEGGVGKTSLLAALRHEEFVVDRRTTHGVEISKVELKVRFQRREPGQPGASQTLVLNVWDFGGQEVYRVAHQFFFSQRSLFLVLWSPRMSEEQCDVRGWIERIRLRVGSTARVLVIATHAETGDRIVRIDKDAIERDFGDIVGGFAEVDSRTGAGIAELRTKLAKMALKLPQMGSRVSPRWLEVRDEVQRSNEPRMRMETFREICGQRGILGNEVYVLAQFLDQLGYVIYYGDDDGLKDELILRPEWLAKAISYVLEDPQTNRDLGVLPHLSLRRIWWDHKNPDFESYDPALHPYFLRLMEKFDVSYRLDEQNSLVAQLVPVARPELPWKPDEVGPASDSDNSLKVVCAMRTTPPGIVPWLIVRTHRYATKPRRHWTRGMFLEDDQHGSAVLDLRDRELHIEVRATYPEHFTVLLADIVERLIKERWPGLEHSLAVPCPTVEPDPCRGRFKLQALRALLAAGTERIPCQECCETWEITRLLIGFAARDRSLGEAYQKVLNALNEAAQQQSALGDRLDEIERQRQRAEAQSLLVYRTMIRLLAGEAVCPRLFTMVPATPAGVLGFTRRLVGFKAKLRLTLWCQHPEGIHPVCPIGSGGFVDGMQVGGEYVFDIPDRAWLKRIGPYARVAAYILKWLPKGPLPLLGDAAENVSEELTKSLEAMERLFPGEHLELMEDTPTNEGTPSVAEGVALRELHSLLISVDRACQWGDLRLAINAAGDPLWLCSTHYEEFDQGLPIIPTPDISHLPTSETPAEASL